MYKEIRVTLMANLKVTQLLWNVLVLHEFSRLEISIGAYRCLA